jgi:hypothetical protein
MIHYPEITWSNGHLVEKADREQLGVVKLGSEKHIAHGDVTSVSPWSLRPIPPEVHFSWQWEP